VKATGRSGTRVRNEWEGLTKKYMQRIVYPGGLPKIGVLDIEE